MASMSANGAMLAMAMACLLTLNSFVMVGTVLMPQRTAVVVDFGMLPFIEETDSLYSELGGASGDSGKVALQEWLDFAKDPLPPPAYTTPVLYNHMPKAGGTYLIKLLRAAVGKDLFELKTEFMNMTHKDVSLKKFVIGSVRNPCDYYLSLWAYGVERGGAMMANIPKEDRWVYSTESSQKDSAGDTNKFRQWVSKFNKPGYPGVMSVRFARSYSSIARHDFSGNEPPYMMNPRDLNAVRRGLSSMGLLRRVDCWVRTESLEDDAERCLLLWHDRTGGEVDWDAYEQAKPKATTLASSHATCGHYFDNETEKLVRTLEDPIFQMFHYKTCCA